MAPCKHSPARTVGLAPIPEAILRGPYTDIVRSLPADQAVVLEFDTMGDLLRGQATLHQAGRKLYGKGGIIRTKRNGYATGGLQLLVWREQNGLMPATS